MPGSRAGHPRLSFRLKKDMDGRDEPGHVPIDVGVVLANLFYVR
jgi:hypothetical protein